MKIGDTFSSRFSTSWLSVLIFLLQLYLNRLCTNIRPSESRDVIDPWQANVMGTLWSKLLSQVNRSRSLPPGLAVSTMEAVLTSEYDVSSS